MYYKKFIEGVNTQNSVLSNLRRFYTAALDAPPSSDGVGDERSVHNVAS